MMSLTIITRTVEQSNEIIHLLLKERLVIEGIIQKNTSYFQFDVNKNVIESDSTMLLCITKGLLFTKIDTLLREKYKDNKPVLYSVPIINMGWEQSKIIIEETQSV